MRELVILKRCDNCGADATETFTVGIVAGESRPQLRTVDLCENHAGSMTALAELLADCAPFNGDAKPETKPQPPDLVACDKCGKTYSARSSLINHVWLVHVGQTRPATPADCPDCGVRLPSTSMGVHRSSAHGYDALVEAYGAARF